MYFLAVVAVLQFLAILVLIFLLDRLGGTTCTVERTLTIFLEEIRRTEERSEAGEPQFRVAREHPAPVSSEDFVLLERDGVVLRTFLYSSSPASAIDDAIWSSPHHYLRHRGSSFYTAQEWERHRKRLRVPAIA